MLSASIQNTFSTWKNNKDTQNSYQKPNITIPTPKYTNNPLGIQKTSYTNTPYLSKSNILYSNSRVVSIVPMYDNYIVIDSDPSESIVADIDSDSERDTDSEHDVEIDIVEIDNINKIHNPNYFINLDNYKLKDPIIQFYFGSITVIGLFILFRLMSKPLK
jgi:hypothetical protein